MARKVAIEVTDTEIEFRSKEYPDVSVIKDGKLPCTVCFSDIKHVILLKEKVYEHVYLNVILCKHCFEFYGNGEFSADEDGVEKYCGWCGQGGSLYICSSCPHAFCKKCLKGNLGRQYFQTVEDSEWCCVFCQPEDLFKLRAQCWAVKQYLEESQTKSVEKERERKSILNIEQLDGGKDFSEQIKIAEKKYKSFLSKIKKIACDLDKVANIKAEFENVEALKSIESLSLALSTSIKTANATKRSIDSYLVRLNKRLQKASRKDSESDSSEHENQVSMKENGLKMKISLSPKKKIKNESENSEENRENNESEKNGNDLNKKSKKNKQDKKENKIKKSQSDSESSVQESINKKDDSNKKSSDNENSAHENVEKVQEDPVLDTSNFDLDSPVSHSSPLEMKGNEENSADEIFQDAVSKPPIKLSLKTGRKSNTKSKPDLDSSDSDLVLKNETKKGKSSNKTPEKEEMKKKNLLSSSDDEMFLSKEEQNSDDKNSPQKAPTKKKNLLSSSDSSSTDPLDSSDEDLKVKQKKPKKEKDESSKSDAKKAKKEKIKAEKESKATLSSSDEDLSNLLKIYNTKTLPKTSDKESSGDEKEDSDEGDKAPKKSKSKKSAKNDELTLEDCLDEDGERVKPVYDLNFVYELDARKDQQLVKGLLDSDSNSSISDLGSIVTMSEEEKEDEGKKKSSGKRNHSDSGSDKERKKVYKDKLLTEKLSSEDTSEEERKWANKKIDDPLKSDDSADDFVTKKKKKVTLKKRKKMFSDSDESEIEAISSSSSSDVELLEEEEKTPKKRKRIRRRSSGSDSVDSEGNKKKAPDSDKKGRKNIRRVLKEDDLEKSTKEALRLEKERKERIKEKQKQYHQMMDFKIGEVKEITEVVLDFDPKTKEPLVSVNKDLVKKLKPHQVEGIKFMWDACFESLKDAKEKSGSGCVLAHCMGLGKTLQVITLIHTLLSNSECNISTVLVVTPVSTVLNWVSEFKKWLKDVGSGQDIEVFHFQRTDAAYRSHQLKEWHRCGGVMIMGYNLFRAMAQPTNRIKKSFRTTYAEKLLDPGPDLVICDEGHILKNESTAISKAMSKLKTRRRIVLTGTPLQNNLVEYHCMVQFVKPNLLGTKKEFKNRFVNPIVNGQFEDSTAYDVKIMKKRAHVLHTMLDGIVQRKDYNVLTPYLPPKFEYVLHIKMTDLQCKLYRHYLDNVVQTSLIRKRLFVDFQNLMRICVHPRALLMKAEKDELAREMRSDEDSEGSLKDFIDDGGDTDTSESSLATSKSGSDSEPVVVKPTRRTRQTANNNDVENEEEVTERKEWWSEIVTKDDFEDYTKSSKLVILFEILKECEICGDKLLIFSQSLFSLDIIEYFLNAVDDGLVEGYKARWIKGRDYFRLDGSTATDTRQNTCKVFNADENSARLFLISTRAGGLGINLTGANRVILFDASWNPSYDVQSIFRIYRFGQTKPCYVYRFLSKGTMEEKIYERQVAKLSTALRVIDEHQIDRHFSHSALAELYTFDPEGSELRGTPVLPKDYLMANLFTNHKEIILSYHQHDSLLENKEDQELTEEERKAAWDEYENEKNPPPQTQMFYDPQANMLQQVNIITDMADKLKNQDPSMTAEQIDEKVVSILSSMPVFNISRERYFQLKAQAPIVKSMLANMLSMNYKAPMMGNFSGANNMQMRPQYQTNQMYQMNAQQQMMNRMQQPFFPSTSKRGPQPPSAANSHFGVQRTLAKVNLPFPQTSTPKPQPNRQNVRKTNKPPEIVELD